MLFLGVISIILYLEILSLKKNIINKKKQRRIYYDRRPNKTNGNEYCRSSI